MDFNKYKNKLIDLKKDLEENGVNDIQSFKDSIGELSLIDNHPADVGDELFERSKDLSIRENNNMMLDKVNDALDNIQKGTYGVCERCGKEIEGPRLEAVPYTDQCMKCNSSKGEDFNRRRPIEEDVLEIPFSRTYVGDSDETAYDGEDSWQDVAKYGTSETGQDVQVESEDMAYEHSNENRGYVNEVEEILQQDMYGNKSINRKHKK